MICDQKGGGEMRKVIIVGSGPAGYAAAVYTARAELRPLILTGTQPGGQLTQTTEVENYPGFPEGIMGPELMERMRQQATKFGAEMVFEKVEALEVDKGKVKLNTLGKSYEAETVIIATGAKPRMLGVGEERLIGRGVSMCAVCDAAFFRDKKVFVVGGGDAAIEDAMALSKFTSKVNLLVRRDELRASKAMQRRVFNNEDKVKIWWRAEVRKVVGKDRLEGLVLEVEGKEREVEAEGLFLAIGHLPATEWLKGSGVELDEKGYIKVGLTVNCSPLTVRELWLSGYPTMTTLEGVFAAGDVVDFRYQQAITAAGLGVMAALDVEKYLSAINK